MDTLTKSFEKRVICCKKNSFLSGADLKFVFLLTFIGLVVLKSLSIHLLYQKAQPLSTIVYKDALC